PPLLLLGIRTVESRRDPDRRALEHGHMRREWSYGRDVLDRARPRADRRDPFPLDRLAVIPPRRVKRSSPETFGPGDHRHIRHVEHAEPADQHVRREDLAAVSGKGP